MSKERELLQGIVGDHCESHTEFSSGCNYCEAVKLLAEPESTERVWRVTPLEGKTRCPECGGVGRLTSDEITHMHGCSVLAASNPPGSVSGSPTMPDHKPWEKVCPYCDGSGGEDVWVPGDQSMREDCPQCHGTGYVPMTTAEMLAECDVVSAGGGVELTVSAGKARAVIYDLDGPIATTGWRDTPDDALRAALEAGG